MQKHANQFNGIRPKPILLQGMALKNIFDFNLEMPGQPWCKRSVLLNQ